jgi:hypothetical protein
MASRVSTGRASRSIVHRALVGRHPFSARARRHRVLAVAAVALLAASAHAQPSTPERVLLPATEHARATVVGRVDDVTKLDRSGYTATLVVERVLAGDVRPGEPIRIGWEELASKPPPRLRKGQRVLIALDDLPQGSLWRERFPAGTSALAIAARGDALLIEPQSTDLELLAGYVQLGAKATPAARASSLARIAAGASPMVARAAVDRLALLPNVGHALDAAATEQLMRTAADERQPLQLRREIIVLAGQARLTAAASALEALAVRDGVFEAEALTSLGEIRGLPNAQVESLLDRKEASVRAVGARFATSALAERRLPSIVRRDPAPAVRAAAAQALVETHTIWGLDAAVPALADPDPQVRSTAAQSLGALGAAGVPALEAVARSQPAEARGAITALAMAGPQGIVVVRQLSQDHPDQRLRDFARLALGQGPHAH